MKKVINVQKMRPGRTSVNPPVGAPEARMRKLMVFLSEEGSPRRCTAQRPETRKD